VLCFWNGFRPQTRHSFPHSMASQSILFFDKWSLESSLGIVTSTQKISLQSPLEIRDISSVKCPEKRGAHFHVQCVAGTLSHGIKWQRYEAIFLLLRKGLTLA
jgi:hypothetical protein